MNHRPTEHGSFWAEIPTSPLPVKALSVGLSRVAELTEAQATRPARGATV